MIDIKKCTGCGVCKSKCPQKAIRMIKNIEGFYYPVIDKDKCTNCNLCEKECPSLLKYKQNYIKAFFARCIDKDILLNSSSGGVFYNIAMLIIAQGGYVCGCVFNDNMEVIHKLTNDIEEVKKMRGSKYVESDLKNTYEETKKVLSKGKVVLYTGTPCNIAGLKKFLNKEYENLITIDLICHGVPSAKFFQKYLGYMNNKYKTEIKKINFRNKSKNGSAQIYPYMLSYFKRNKQKLIKNPYLDPFYYAFHKGMNFRESCYNCAYANEIRISDITLGDAWGIDDEHKEIGIENGASIIIINSLKGEYIFGKIKNKMIFKECNIEKFKENNNNLVQSIKRPNERDNIYKELENKNFEYIKKKYLKPKKFIYLKVKEKIPDCIKKILKH